MTIIVLFANQGNLVSDLSKYQSDLTLFIIYLGLGYLLTNRILSTRAIFDIKCIVLTLLYFLSALGMFSDGYAAGWSHTSGALLEKLITGSLISFIILFSFYMPIILVFSLIHNAVITAISDW
jgi:hypothetical protein